MSDSKKHLSVWQVLRLSKNVLLSMRRVDVVIDPPFSIS